MKIAKIIVPVTIDLDYQLLHGILGNLPYKTKVVSIVNLMSQASKEIIVENRAYFRDATISIPEIIVTYKSNIMGSTTVDIVDYSAATAPPAPYQGPQTTCTRAGCFPGSPCYMCTANANSYTLPTVATPSPWGQSVASPQPSSVTWKQYTPPKMPVSSCNHSWKTYDSGWSRYDFCEHCNEKKT